MIFHIAARELRSLFLSPLAWAILGVVQFILAWLFAVQLQNFLITEQARLHLYPYPVGVTELVIVRLYDSAATIMMFTVPLITMRIISEEKRSNSIALLYSAPLSMTEIVLGKYLGVVAFLTIMTGVYTLMPLSLVFAGSIDWGLLASTLLGTLMMVSTCAAIGLYMSSLTKQPTIAAMSTFGAILFLLIIFYAGDSRTTEGTNIFSYISLLDHMSAFFRGIFNTSDFIYYLIVITIFLVLSIRRLDGDRLQR
jgi:ABC-2 type transport system permease protein